MNDPAAELPPIRATSLVGARWALGLGAALLIAFAVLTAARWSGRPAAAVEEVVQVPPPAAVSTPAPEILAPDPGDHP